MAQKRKASWENYLAQSNCKKLLPDKLILEGIEKLMDVKPHAFNVLNHSVPMIYLLDYTTGKYVFVSSHCDAHLLFFAKKMLEGGLDFVIENYHPEDFKLFNEEIFSDRLSMIKDIPIQQHKDLIFSLNFRIKNGKGEFVNLLQRSSFIQSDEDGNPLLSMGVITNINHFKAENPVIQLLEKVDAVTGITALVQKNTYFHREEDKIFSKREREILPYVADGLTSKQIAEKLFIIEHTVINHKRNMQDRSDTQNSAGLINFVFRHHLL